MVVKMKKFKKIISLVLVCTMITGSAQLITSAEDVNSQLEFEQEILEQSQLKEFVNDGTDVLTSNQAIEETILPEDSLPPIQGAIQSTEQATNQEIIDETTNSIQASLVEWQTFTVEVDTIPMTFQILSLPNESQNGTVQLGVDDYFTPSVPSSTSGNVEVPSIVEFEGNTFDVVTISSGAFVDCIDIESVNIPSSVNYINDSAFVYCESLMNINVSTDNISYSSVEGVLFNKDKTVLVRYPEGRAGEYIMSDITTLTEIGTRAFQNCRGLTSIKIPNSVTKISGFSFLTCENLSSVTFSSTLAEIGEYAFNGAGLQELTLPDSLVKLGEGAFSNAGSLTTVTLPDNLAEINANPFYSCSRLTEINISSNNQTFTSENGVLFNKNKTELIAYPDAKSDTDYTVANTVTHINEYAFYGGGFETITFNEGLLSIGNNAFYNCYKVTTLKIPEGVTTIGDNAFASCYRIKSITLPNSINFIGTDAFSSIDNLNQIFIPVGNEYLKQYCTENSLKYIELEEGVPPIALYSTHVVSVNNVDITVYVNSLPTSTENGLVQIGGAGAQNAIDTNYVGTIYIPASVDIEGYTFDVADINPHSFPEGVTEIIVDDNSSYLSSYNGVLFNKDKTTLILYPKGKQDESYDIPYGVTTIGRSAFADSKMQNITIPSTVTNIGTSAFYSNFNLTSITIPEGVKEISDSAFSFCSNLEEVSFPSTLIKIGESAFKGSPLIDIQIPESVTEIGNSAFERTALYRVTIPNGVTTIGDNAFSIFTLASVVLPNSVTHIGQNAFSSGYLEQIFIPVGNEYLKQYCTENSLKYTELEEGQPPIAINSVYTVTANNIDMKVTVLSLATDSENGTVLLGGDFHSIVDTSYNGSLYLPNTVDIEGYIFDVVDINPTGFENCYGLNAIYVYEDNPYFSSIDGVLFNKEQNTLIYYPIGRYGEHYQVPLGVISIGESAFRNSNLKSIDLAETLTTIEDSAFYGAKIEGIDLPDSLTTVSGSSFVGAYYLRFIRVTDNNPNFSSVDGILLNKEKTIIIAVPNKTNGVFSIPEGVISIVGGDINPTFTSNHSITNLTIPSSVLNIDNDALKQLIALKEIHVSSDNPNFSSVDGVLLNKEKTTILKLPVYRSNDSDYTVPEGVTHIAGGDNPVFGLPNNFKNITLPSTLLTMDSDAFANCYNLTSINVSENNPNYSSIDGVLFNKDKSVLTYYPSNKGAIYQLPKGVSTISSNAFSSGNRLEVLILNDDVTNIEERAFEYNSSLTHIYIPENNQYLKQYCIDNLLNYIEYSDGKVPIIQNNVYTINVDGVDIDFKVLSLPTDTESGTVQVGGGAVAIDTLTTGAINIPSTVFIDNTNFSVVSIGESAFVGCEEITSVSIPNSITDIVSISYINPFNGCENLTEIIVASDNSNYSSEDGVLLSKDKTVILICPPGKTGDYSIPETVYSFGQSFAPIAFQGCDRLTSISIPASVTYLPWYIFKGCSSLTNISIPSSITSIGRGAFQNCSSLQSITIPSLVTELDTFTFEGCNSLREINVDSDNANLISIDGVLYSKDGKRLLIYPSGKTDESYSIEESVEIIDFSAFINNSNLISLNIPKAVKEIGSLSGMGESGFFDGCTALEEINVEEGSSYYTSEDGVLFKGIYTSGRTLMLYPYAKPGNTYIVPQFVSTINDSSLAYAKNLTDIAFYPSVSDINAQNNSWDSRQNIYIPSNSTYLKDYFANTKSQVSEYEYKFDYQDSYKTINVEGIEIGFNIILAPTPLSNGKVEIGVFRIGMGNEYPSEAVDPSVLSGHYNIPATVEIDGDIYEVAELGSSLFGEASALTSITIPKTVTYIDGAAFSELENLKSIEVSTENKNYTSVDGVLYSKDRTKIIFYPAAREGSSYIIPEGVADILYAFTNAKNLVSINIPASVVHNGNSALFNGCSLLSEIIVAQANQTLSSEDGVLYNKDKTTIVKFPEGKTGEFNMPDSVEANFTTEYALSNCENLTAINVSDNHPSYSSINGVLYNKDETELLIYPSGKAGDYTIPESVTSVNHSAFSNGNKITSLNIHDNIANLSWYSNRVFTSNTAINVNATNSNYSSEDGVLFNKDKTELIAYPAGKVGGYTIPDGVNKIMWGAFQNSINLTSVSIPDTVVEIQDVSFANCTSLSEVTIPDSVTILAWSVFSNCDALTSVTVPGSVNELGLYVFAHCDNLVDVTILEGVTRVDDLAFYDSNKLESVTVPNSVTYVSDIAFKYCDKFDTMLIPVGNELLKQYCINNGFDYNYPTDVVPEIGGTGATDLAPEIPKNDISDIFTEEDLIGGEDLKVKLDVNKVEESTVTPEEKVAIDSKIEDFIKAEGTGTVAVAQLLDIDLKKTVGATETAITELTKAIRITLTIPSELIIEGVEYVVVRVHNGVAEVLEDLDNDPNTITIETDRFSTYALASVKARLLGDVNASGTVDISDSTEIANVGNYNKTKTEAGVDAYTDLNDDGVVNFLDVAISRNSSNFGKSD